MANVEVVTTYLEMTSPAELRPALSDDPSVRVRHVTPCPAEVYRGLYRGVGRTYNWHQRYHWTDEQIVAAIAAPGVSVHVLYCGDTTAGYFELRTHEDRSVEILYFGLLPPFVGRGLGKHLLTVAVQTAWGLKPARVWLHTCSLDHPAAKANYLARGFRQVRETVSQEPVLEA